MPKTAKNLWGDIACFSNLALAYHRVRKAKRYDSDTIGFYANLEENLFALEDALRRRTWRPEPFREFTVTVPKLRLVQAPSFGDRVIHQAVTHITAPVFERRFIYDSYANRVGFGTHLASRRLRSFMRSASAKWERPYCIKADIKSYFPSVNHDTLMTKLRRLFADDGVLWFFDTLIRGSGYTDCGLPIGSLTSQWLANLYLDDLDHYAKDILGLPYYLRYMDDFVLICPSKAQARETLEKLDSFVLGLHLRLNPKTAIMPLSKGVDFVGYRHWTSHVLPRKSTVARARRTFKSLRRRFHLGHVDLDYIRPRVASFTGYMSHCDGHRTLAGVLDKFILSGENRA
jgi:retron-type reverse transcriptase